MSAPSSLTITYVSTLPSTTSTQTLSIPDSGGSQANYSLAVRNLARTGGFWFTDTTGLLTFIPLSQITKITAQ